MIIQPADVKPQTSYFPILLEAILVDSILEFDLFIQVNNQMVLYRSTEMPFTERTRQKLLDNKVGRLYITNEKVEAYQRYIENNLSKILSDPNVREDKKASILYQTSTTLVKDVLANPTLGDNIKRAQEMVSSTVKYILLGRQAFHSLMKITSFDYYTYTHSVNVCTYSIALAQQMGLNDEQFLHELGTGALLHDVGKSRVSDRILNKRGRLNQVEFEIIKKHPQWGVEILRDTNEISEDSLFPILQHHERGDCQGYPHGISLDDMHIFSKIVAIADAFDAMTTQRVYQKAVGSYPALKLMFLNRGWFDSQLLRAFVELMGPTDLADL